MSNVKGGLGRYILGLADKSRVGCPGVVDRNLEEWASWKGTLTT